MTTNKQLRELAESVMHWSSSLTAAWPSDPDFNDVWAVGAIDEDGNRYPVIEVDAADQYDSPGDSEGIAQFLSAASPESVLRLLDEIEALQAECNSLRKDASRLDWLADPENEIGEVLLPTEVVEQNPHSMRDAIDAAMEMQK